MSKRNRGRGLIGICGIAVCTVSLAVQPAQGGGCPCDASVVADPPGPGVDFGDLIAIIECVEGRRPPGDPACDLADVNCDGVVDECDLSNGVAQFLGMPAPTCDVPCGACCRDGQTCVEVQEFFCNGNPFFPQFEGIYLGDGTTCNPSQCDCNGNLIPDADDIAGGTSDDCNGNGQPDECEEGSCCLVIPAGFCNGGQNDGDPCTNPEMCLGGICPDVDSTACASTTKDLCDQAVFGTWLGVCTKCPEQNAAIIPEGDGTIFIHVIGPPVECPVPGGRPAGVGVCTGPPYNDAWISSSTGNMCHNFGVTDSPPIPADFFDPGSDPFVGAVCLVGEPLNAPGFGAADTLILRSDDPFDRCELPGPQERTVDIEIVALSLKSIDPITVTVNGGQNPEQWDVFVDLSASPVVPQGTLTATKTHCNGGTYTSTLHVRPRFTFTRVSNPADTRVLDTGAEGIPPVQLDQPIPSPWVSDLDPDLTLPGDPCTSFHAGLVEANQSTLCDTNSNGVLDACDADSPRALSGDDTCHDGENDTGFACSQTSDCASGVCGVKNRHVSATFAVGTGIDFAVNVEIVASTDFPGAVGNRYWAAAPQQWSEGPTGGQYLASELGCAPAVRNWTADGLVDFWGAPVVPGAVYAIRTATQACIDSGGTGCMSIPLFVATSARWADVVPPFARLIDPDFGDIGSIVDKFKSKPGAPRKARSLLCGEVPDPTLNVGFDQINACVGGFKGKLYAQTCDPTPAGPQACP